MKVIDEKDLFNEIREEAVKCGWSNAKLLDRLNELGVETTAIRTEENELVPTRINGLTEAIALKVRQEIAEFRGDQIMGEIKTELHSDQMVSAAYLDELYKTAADNGLDEKWTDTKLREFGATIQGHGIKLRTVSFLQYSQVLKIVNEIKTRGEAYDAKTGKKDKQEKLKPVDSKSAEDQERWVATYKAMVAQAELNGISSEEIDMLLEQISPDRTLSDKIIGNLAVEINAYIEMMGGAPPSPKSDAETSSSTNTDTNTTSAQLSLLTGIESQKTSQETSGSASDDPVKAALDRVIKNADQLKETLQDLGGELKSIDQTEKEATCQTPVSANTSTSAPANTTEISTGATTVQSVNTASEESATTKGRKKQEKKSKEKEPKEPKQRAETDPVFTSDNNPENFITHSVRLGKLKETLISVAQHYESADDLILHFEPYPFGLFVEYRGEGEGPGELKLSEIAVTEYENYEDEIRRCYIHAVDYLAMRRKTKAEIDALDEDYKRCRKDLEDKLSGSEFVYHASFFDWALRKVQKMRKPDGTYKSKTIKTLGGCVSIKKTGGVKLSDKEKLTEYFRKLFKKRESTDEKEAKEARDTLDACLVTLETVKVEQLEYNWTEIVKPLAESGLILPGVIYQPVDELGRLEYDG